MSKQTAIANINNLILQERGEGTSRKKHSSLDTIDELLEEERQREEERRQRNAASAGEAMDLVRSFGDYGLERRAAEAVPPVTREAQPTGGLTPAIEAEYQRRNSGPYKLTPYQVYMNAQVSAAAEPETQNWKRPAAQEAPMQKLTPDVEAERLRRASGQGPSNGLTPYAQYRATYEAQRQNEAKKARENAESGWSFASDTLKGGAQAFEAMMQNPLATLDKLDYWIMNKLGGTFGGIKANTKQAYDAAHAIDTDIQRSVSAAKAGKGKWASSIIDAFGAAGNIFGSSMMGYGLTGMGTATNALNTVAGKLSAATAGPGAGLGERAVAGASRLAGNVLGDIAANPTNLFISAQSGIGTFDTAKNYGADDRTAATAGLAAAMTEYLSNKMFSGTPLEDNPNEKGYVVELLEDITDGLAKTGKAGARFQKYAGQFFSNPVVNFVFDKSGEGMEEVITGVLDPWIARLTYNKDEDLATFETLFDDYIGGVLMSLLVGAPQAAVNATQNAANLVIRGAENTQSAGWTGNTFNAYTQRFMQNPDWAEKSRGSAEIAERAEASDSESLRRYADIYNRMDDVLAMLDGKDPDSVGETAFVNSMEAQNYFYIWANQGARAADAYYEQNVYAAARNRQAQAEATYQQQQAEKQAREAARQQAEQEAQARQTQAEETLAQQGPPLPQAAQNTPESVTTPPLPGNAQRGAEGQREAAPEGAERKNVPADIKTGVPVQDGVTGAAETSGNNVTQQGETVKGPPVPGRGNERSTAAGEAGLRIPGSRAESNATVKALQTVSPELLEAYMTEGTDGDTTISDAVAAVQREVQKGTISARAGAEFLDMMWQAGSDAESRNGFLKSIYDTNTGDLRPQALNAVQRIDARNRNGGLRIGQAENPAAAVGQQARTGQAEAATAAAAAEAGNDLADGGRGRIPGQRAGEQNGRLAEAKRAVSQYNKASGRRADAKNLRAEEVDARERIPAAAKGSKITLAPAQMVQQDKELRTVAQRLEQITGKKVYYTLGNIQRQGAGGRVSQARGAITADGIYLRCDHNDLSVTQLAAHELYHYYEQLYPGLSARMKEKIIQTYSEEEFNKVAKVYVEKLGAINGLTDNQDAEAREAALTRIEKEIFADAFGSINYGGAKADRFNALVRQTLNETMGAETEAATARKTGPPTQFSEDERRQKETGRITENDIQTLRSIGRKSVNSFTSEDIQKAEKWARIYERDLKTKSPFFRAWFGDWRANDASPIKVAEIPQYTPTNEFRKTNRGTYNNADTGWDITVSREGETNTISHAGAGRLSEYGLAGIKSLVENAVLLDTEVHEHHDNNAANDNIAFDHKLYALGQNEDGIALYKVTVEEYLNDPKHTNVKRFHNLVYIEKVADIAGGRDTGTSRAGVSTNGKSTTNYTVADIYQYVKQYDKRFQPGSNVNPAMLEEDGTPRRFYHGTEADFTVFDRTKGRSTMDIQGSFFSPWELDAEGYGSKVGAYYLNLKNPAPEGTAYKVLNRFKGQNNAGIKAREYLERQGYDGVNNSDEEFIAFNPEQIKSATDNIGTYDRDNPDTLFSADEEEIPQSATEYARMKERDKKREAELLRLVKKGEATEAQKQEAAALKEKLKGPKAAVKKSQATIAKKQLRNTIISEFGIPDGRKAEIGKMIDAYADRLIKEKEISWSDRLAFFRKLYDEGVMTVPADDMYQAAREIVRGGKVYVSEKIKHEFGDDWASFRRQAFAEGIYLTNNPADKSADSWNVELSSEFPGMFPEDNYDQKDILERIVSAAQAGRDEQMSLAEYAAKVVGQEYVSEDEAMDNMERRLDWALRSFAENAGLETWLKDKAEEKLAKQREQFGERLDAIRAQEIARQAKERDKRKEAARKQTLNRELREMQQRTLKQLQWLSKNRQKFSGNMQDQLNEILSDIDVYAISAADEAHLDKASNKTWRELADIYKDAKENDPNFLPSKDLERIVARLDNRKIGDMDIDAVTDLYKAAVGLRTELYNRNNVIGSELHETFQEVYDQVKDEMQSAKGGYKTGAKGLSQKFFSDLQLTPMNVLERMAGWNKDSAWYKMAKQLEQGERAQRKFKTDSARMLAPFLEEHKDWVKKADGQGKDAIWYEVEVPELLELGMGDKPIFGNTVKVYMTPAQKVHMYLESQNYDNLRHMTGGRTFADRELYSKGKRAEAFAQGKTIRLAPETVKNLVKDLTPEEKALADALRPFYNDFSKKEINRVSNLLLGYNKAMEGDYAPIYTNQNYTKSEPGIFDTTAEGVGNLKSRVVSSNPSLNISALDAFEKSVDRTSRYVGLAIPVRNMNTLMNWREKGNSMADVLTHKWGEDGKNFVNDLLTELQSGRETDQSSIEKLTNAALSRYISAVFGANPSIVAKQFASYPLAAAYLGWENMPVNIPRAAQVDTDLIAKYTGEYDYRQLGYAMPETATLKDNPGKLQEKGPLNFLFGGGAITWMDGFTVRTLWSWAENKVNKEQPGLERGSQAQIDAGNSEYYKAVAAEFEEAVSRSQPMYDTMHRANIMRESNPITRAFTLFKTVPMQEYNMLRQAIGEAQYAKENNLDKETQAAARQKAGRAFAGILSGNLMIGAITVLNALWKNRGKKYRDEDGELSAEKLIAEAGKQYFKDAAGLVIGGGEAADVLSSILFGEKWYGLETPGMEQIGSILEQTVKAGQTVGKLVQDSIEVLQNGGNWAQYMADHSDTYLSAVDSIARTLGTYATGMPIDNVKAYLLGAVQWLSPEVKTAYEDIMDKAERSGLKGLSGASLEIRTKHILQERAGSAEDSTVEALAGLYAAGYKDAIPAAQVTKITVDGDERQLNLAQQQTYKKAWQETVGGSLNELVSSKEFQEADEKTQAKMLKKLYDLATDRAKSALFDDVEDNTWEKAQDMLDAGIKLEDYVSAYARFNAIKNDEDLSSYERGKEQREMISGMDYSDEAKLALYENLNPSATSRIEKFREIMDTGMGFDDVMKVYDKYAAIDERGDLKAGEKAKDFALWVDTQKYSANQKAAIKDQLKYGMYMSMDTERYDKLTGKGLDPTTAYNVDQAISSLTPKAGTESVSDTQKWQAAMKNTSGEANQKKALEALMTEEQYAKFQKTGVSASAYVNYRVAVSDLKPLAGQDGVTNAQKWNAALKSQGTSASKKDKLALVGDIVGTNMTTKTGEPTMWAKINRVVDSGKSVEETMKLVEDEKLDVYVRWMDSDAKAAGVKSETYLAWRETYANTNSTRDENGKEVKGQKKKDKILAYIDGLNLTREQKDALFLEEYKESGLKDTPWHSGGGKGSGSYAMARTPALRIPEAPKAEKIQSGLWISTGTNTAPRQGSGLRIPAAASAAPRQSSGLRIRAK